MLSPPARGRIKFVKKFHYNHPLSSLQSPYLYSHHNRQNNRNLTSIAPGDDGKVSGVGDGGAGGAKARPVPGQKPERGSNYACTATKSARRDGSGTPVQARTNSKKSKKGLERGGLTGAGEREDDPLPPVFRER
jgi:hypothetical protein